MGGRGRNTWLGGRNTQLRFEIRGWGFRGLAAGRDGV
jgi:hypothetical protein